MVNESQILTPQLEKLNAKIEQATRIEGKLRARKQAAIAEKNERALQQILTREKSVIDICVKGLTIASALISATTEETKPLKPTKELEDIVDLIKSGLKNATAGVQIWQEELTLWNRFLAAGESERQGILEQIKAKQYQRDALTARLRQAEQLNAKIKGIQEDNVKLLKTVVAVMTIPAAAPLVGSNEPTQQTIGILIVLGSFLYLMYKTFGEKVLGVERKAL